MKSHRQIKNISIVMSSKASCPKEDIPKWKERIKSIDDGNFITLGLLIGRFDGVFTHTAAKKDDDRNNMTRIL